MGNGHQGIDLDVICLDDLSPASAGSSAGEIHADPEDYRVFVNDIFKRMKGQESFLSFSRQINDVNRILTMDYSSAGDIARVILRDMGLTAQVLKLVNSSFYRQFSNTRGISTISEAMIILGTDEVRLAAAGLKIFEMMQELANSRILKQKTLSGLQRSIMARQIALDQGNAEGDALQISAMLYELGEYLVALFDPQTYIRIEILMEEEARNREEAAKCILGLGYSDLGRVVALKLNMPQGIVKAMQPVTRFDLDGQQIGPQTRQRYLCAFIHELCQISENGPGKEEMAGRIVDKYSGILDFDLRQAMELLAMSREKLVKHAALLKIRPDEGQKGPDNIRDRKGLQQGLEKIKAYLNSRLSIHEIFTRMVRTLYESFYFSQVVICIKNKEARIMAARFVKGPEATAKFLKAFSFRIQPGADLFNRAISRDREVVVRDTARDQSAKQIPSWYMEKIFKAWPARGFAVFPVCVDGKTISMIYLAWDAPEPDQKTLEYIRIFRQLMVKTFTLHSQKVS